METPRPFGSNDAAKLYKSFRPHYPEEIYETILGYYKERRDSFSLAVDIGCGTGLSTVPLAQYFDKVIGLDRSEAQLSQADRMKSNVSYNAGNAEDLSFCESGSVDLVTVMMALHWIEDKDKFYREVKRVLKPDGVVAFCAYWATYMDLGPEEATKVVCSEFVEDVIIKGGYIQSTSFLIPEMYTNSFTLPFRDFQRKTDIEIKKTLTLPQIEGFFRSTACFQNYLKSNPKSTVLEEKWTKSTRFWEKIWQSKMSLSTSPGRYVLYWVGNKMSDGIANGGQGRKSVNYQVEAVFMYMFYHKR